jgi:hypothetical protein
MSLGFGLMFGIVTNRLPVDAGGGLIALCPDWAPSTYPFPATVRMGWCVSLSFGRGGAPVIRGIGPVAQLVRAHA